MNQYSNIANNKKGRWNYLLVNEDYKYVHIMGAFILPKLIIRPQNQHPILLNTWFTPSDLNRNKWSNIIGASWLSRFNAACQLDEPISAIKFKSNMMKILDWIQFWHFASTIINVL